jgi:hypothetical protein
VREQVQSEAFEQRDLRQDARVLPAEGGPRQEQRPRHEHGGGASQRSRLQRAEELSALVLFICRDHGRTTFQFIKISGS